MNTESIPEHSDAARDRLSIQELVERVSQAVKERDWPALDARLAADIVWERVASRPWRFEGRDAVLGFLICSADFEDVVHRSLSTSAIVLQSAERALVRSTVTELIRSREWGTTVHAIATYTHELVRDDGEWRLARRAIHPHEEQDLSLPTRT